MKYVAMLRGINIGARNRIAMPELKAAFESKGFNDVETYVQSGNVIFQAPEESDSALAAAVHDLIAAHFNLDIPVVARSSAELTQIVKNNPFLKQPDIDETKLHVTFLAETPATGLIDAVKDTANRGDEWELVGNNLYLHCPIDYGHTKLTNAYLEKKLKTNATTRNWNSVTTLAELAAS